MVLRFRSDSREISFRLDDCPSRTTGRYSPSEQFKCTGFAAVRQYLRYGTGVPGSRTCTEVTRMVLQPSS